MTVCSGHCRKAPYLQGLIGRRRVMRRDMDRVVITIHPTPSDEGLQRVSDAMQQVDALRVFEQAERGLGPPQEYFEWRLKRAAADSVLPVVPVADPLDS